MAVKTQIVAELGEADLLLPDRIARALAANDQVKYYFALLQLARTNADRPMVPAADLKSERLASRIDDAWLDDTVATTHKVGDDRYLIPRLADILTRIDASLDIMIACLADTERQGFVERLARIARPQLTDGEIRGSAIDRMTSGNAEAGDSLHLVVMQAHKAINQLQAATAVETLHGARVHNLSKRSRRLVEAFMTGLERTAPLKFDHPGLGTTATEHDGRLLIQNDIGTTDAHVLVLRVDDLVAALTYTDIHARRLAFFQSLFSDFGVRWENAATRTSGTLDNGTYLLTTGIYEARDDADLARYLDHLGSRIVFLIDWNKMRKRLQGFVGKDSAIRVIRWAARHDFGHRALLEIGGEKLLGEAVEYALGKELHYGDRLDVLIGADAAERFLCRALELASLGLRQRRSRRHIADEIKAEARRHFETSRLAIFTIAARHAACGFDLAVTLRESLELVGRPSCAELVASAAARAATWETKADQLLNQARDDIDRFSRPLPLRRFFESADDAVDELEEAAALLETMTLVPIDGVPFADLRALGDVALGSAQELVKCIECAATITRSDVRDDLDDFSRALDRLMELEHRADALLRQARKALIRSVESARTLYLVDQLARALEAATDAYAHSGQSLRVYLMEEVLA